MLVVYCAVGQRFNLRFMYLILMYIDISLEMFTLMVKVSLCCIIYVYIFIPVLLLQGLIVCDVNKEKCETMIQRSASIFDIYIYIKHIYHIYMYIYIIYIYI